MYLLTGLNRPRQSWGICLDWNQIKQICHPGFPAELVLQFTCINPKSHLDDGKRPQIPSGKGLYLFLPGNMLCSCSALPLAQISINFCPSQWMRISISLPSYIKALLFLQLAFLLVCWPLSTEEVWPLARCSPGALTRSAPVDEWWLKDGWFLHPCPDEHSWWKLSLWSCLKTLVLGLQHLPICVLCWIHLEPRRSMNTSMPSQMPTCECARSRT